jgi:uncharacterized protein (TIGR02147 family)
MNSEPIKPSIFNYFDYREYLADVFAVLEKKRHGYSYRNFSREAGIASHNFLPRILRRERNLSEDFIPQLGSCLKLTIKELNYFRALVAFNNTKRPSEKECCLKVLLKFRYESEEHKIEDAKLGFFDKWYYPVVRELVTLLDFQEDYALLARHAIPRITAAQAKSAVAFLLKNGFIKKESNGRYVVANAIISTESEVDSAIVPKYHKAALEQCIDAIETVKKEDRNFTSSTLLVSRELYEDFKTEIELFRKRLLSMAKECKSPDMVCLAAFQLLPRSERVSVNGIAGRPEGGINESH